MSAPRMKKVKALVAKFRSVTAERLERLGNSFVQLETDPNDGDAAASLVREIHTLKGEAKLMGFEQVNVVAHRTEDLIFRARDLAFVIPDSLGSAILAGLDLIAALMREDGAGPADVEAYAAKVEAILRGTGEGHPPERPPAFAEKWSDIGRNKTRVGKSVLQTAGFRLAAKIIAVIEYY